MIIPAGYAQVNFRFSGAAVPRGAEVVIGVDNTTVPYTASAIGALAAGFWDVDLGGAQATVITLDDVLVKLGPNDTGASSVVVANTSGGDTAQALPANVALLVRKITNLGGRKGRGRMYIPGITEAESPGGGEVLSSFVTGVQTAVDSFLDDLASVDIPMVLLHGDATTPTPVVALQVDNVFASQRDRMR